MANRNSPRDRGLSSFVARTSMGCAAHKISTLGISASFGADNMAFWANARPHRVVSDAAFILSQWFSNVVLGWAKWRAQWSISQHHDTLHQSRAGIHCSLRRSVSLQLSHLPYLNLRSVLWAAPLMALRSRIAHLTKTFVPKTSPQKDGRAPAAVLFGVWSVHMRCTRNAQVVYMNHSPISEVRPC